MKQFLKTSVFLLLVLILPATASAYDFEVDGIYYNITHEKKTPVHRPLIEEYTGTWCGWCVRGIVGMELLRETFGEDFIGVAYHNGDAMEVTSSFPNSISGYPSAFIERTYDVDPLYGFSGASGDIVSDMQQIAAMEVIAGIDVTAQWTSADKTEIDVNVTTYFTVDNDNANYAIEVMLVADDLYGTGSGWTQANYYHQYATQYAKDPYLGPWTKKPANITDLHFNNVLVGTSGVISGSLPTNLVAYDDHSYNYTFTLNTLPKPELVQNKDNLHVIVIIVNTDTHKVVNANKCNVISLMDTKANGNYDNNTDNNTVEVTYKDTTRCSYQDTVVIPQNVVFDGVTYQVTAIGDSAFYAPMIIENDYWSSPAYDKSLKGVNIPSSVTIIGKDAFAGCLGLTDVTCHALTPPTNYGHFEPRSFNGDSYYDVDVDGGYYYSHYDTRPWAILHVPLNSCDAYRQDSQWSDFFNFVIPIGAEKTDPPIIIPEYTVDNGHLYVITISTGDDCTVYGTRKYGRPSHHIFYDWAPIGSIGIEELASADYAVYHPNDYDVSAFAIAEGKRPSEIVGVFGGVTFRYFDGSSDIIALLYEEYLGEYQNYSYDFKVDGICYNFINDSTVHLASDVCESGRLCNRYYYNCTLNDIRYDVEYHREGCYNGEVIIPSTVEYNGKSYNVTGISESAFAGQGVYIYDESVYQYQGFDDWNYRLIPWSDLNSIVIPVSVTSIGDYTFHIIPSEYVEMYNLDDDCPLEFVRITGDGEWQAGTLPEGLKTLYIESGVTGVKGMKVNPETIYCYATTPPVCDENSFTGYDAELHVPAASLAAYFTAPYWCNFTNIIGDRPLNSITLNRDSIELQKGTQDTIRVTLNPANAMPNTVTWSSSDESVAKVENGVVTALKGGQCDITASCQDKRAVCHVKVTEILPTSVTLNQENAKMEIGSQLTLTATVLPEDATDKTVSWRSSNQSVATVDENGVVTAVGTGECDITAYCGGKQAVCHVIVVEQFIYISLDSHEASVLPNHIIMLTPTVSPVSTDLVVTSSNPAVAAARMAGNKIQVVGVSEGKATIVVNSADGYAFADSCQVRVYTERGDVNGDGFVDIADVSALIDYLLDGDASEVNEVNADTNANGDVGIADVSMLIDYLLGSTELPPKEEDGMVEYAVNGVTFKMVKVEGGTFTMGATEEEDADYQVFKGSPKHQVTLSEYWIGQTEVTQELWAAVMGSNPSSDQSNLQYPVNSISWEDCATFISQLNQLTGKQFRLPTEAEWEYAAKGGAKSMGYVYSGSDNLDEVAWFSTNSESHLHQVATKKANELGLYDMCGNIDEWCNDWYSLYTADPVENPTGPETGMSRIHRGGRWNASAMYCRLTRRDGFAPGVTRNYLGLRLALTE